MANQLYPINDRSASYGDLMRLNVVQDDDYNYIPYRVDNIQHLVNNKEVNATNKEKVSEVTPINIAYNTSLSQVYDKTMEYTELSLDKGKSSLDVDDDDEKPSMYNIGDFQDTIFDVSIYNYTNIKPFETSSISSYVLTKQPDGSSSYTLQDLPYCKYQPIYLDAYQVYLYTSSTLAKAKYDYVDVPSSVTGVDAIPYLYNHAQNKTLSIRVESHKGEHLKPITISEQSTYVKGSIYSDDISKSSDIQGYTLTMVNHQMDKDTDPYCYDVQMIPSLTNLSPYMLRYPYVITQKGNQTPYNGEIWHLPFMVEIETNYTTTNTNYSRVFSHMVSSEDDYFLGGDNDKYDIAYEGEYYDGLWKRVYNNVESANNQTVYLYTRNNVRRFNIITLVLTVEKKKDGAWKGQWINGNFGKFNSMNLRVKVRMADNSQIDNVMFNDTTFYSLLNDCHYAYKWYDNWNEASAISKHISYMLALDGISGYSYIPKDFCIYKDYILQINSQSYTFRHIVYNICLSSPGSMTGNNKKYWDACLTVDKTMVHKFMPLG